MRGNDERDDDGGVLWRIVTDHPDVFDAHVVPKLNGNDVKFFYDVNSESRRAIRRSGVQLPDAFEIGDFDTKSTLSWALEKCSEEKDAFKETSSWPLERCSEGKKRFCEQMTRNGNVELLKFLRGKGCPWDEWTCRRAAEYGHLECLKYAHENGCPWDSETCSKAAKYGDLECLKYGHENGCPWDERTCANAAKYGHLECLEYARENGCPFDEEASASEVEWSSEWDSDSHSE